MLSRWPHAQSPFHAGEQKVQERVGVRESIEAFARRVVRDHMPDQHRDFYGKLPFVMIGTVDDAGRPWASLVPGRPGFISSPDARLLDISASSLPGDPLHQTLKPGAAVGLLGIELHSRRRNRLTGRVASVRANGFAINVDQAFGNCPQYIQARDIEVLPDVDNTTIDRQVARSDRLDARARDLIAEADTLFIATAYGGDANNATHGADVSHRGGKPGFVRVEDDRTFVFPDFSGNNHFNTIGNIELNPKAGFLFANFESGDVLYLTGDAEIVWEGEEVHAFAGAERLIRFRVDEAVYVEASLPLRFRFESYSPMLDLTGSWEQATETIAANKERNAYVPFDVFKVERESDVISSFYLRRADGKALATHEPGQYLPIRLQVAGDEEAVRRTYTISDAPNGAYYRLSVKREGGDAVVSRFLHDNANNGLRLEAMAPRGKFVLDGKRDRPVVLLSAGVGITPMIAMANAVVAEGKRTRNFRKTYFVHGARDGQTHAFGDHMRALADAFDAINVHIRYSDPGQGDQIGATHDSEGRVDIELLKRLLPFDDYDFYMCGPQTFMQSLYDGLLGLDVRDARIHYESFGPATVLKQGAKAAGKPTADVPQNEPVAVHFSGSNIKADWTQDKGTLLELAEAAGLSPAFSCRSGTCGTCATRLTCGAVDYLEEPSAPVGEGEVLICCATPRAKGGMASCGEVSGVVIDL